MYSRLGAFSIQLDFRERSKLIVEPGLGPSDSVNPVPLKTLRRPSTVSLDRYDSAIVPHRTTPSFPSYKQDIFRHSIVNFLQTFSERSCDCDTVCHWLRPHGCLSAIVLVKCLYLQLSSLAISLFRFGASRFQSPRSPVLCFITSLCLSFGLFIFRRPPTSMFSLLHLALFLNTSPNHPSPTFYLNTRGHGDMIV